MELVETIEQRLGIAGHRPSAIALALRPGIIEKLHRRPATAFGGIRYHLAVPAGTENGQTLHVQTHRKKEKRKNRKEMANADEPHAPAWSRSRAQSTWLR
ncbi:hypothetical protein D3C71_2047400 [compost metagenome]